jgi:DNA polymerase I-like protein with 3'-5' exonuclease and polymerase domains
MKKKIRSMFIAPPGHFLANFDLSQAESWVVAFLANEARMKKALMFGDIHTETAGNALFFGDLPCEHKWVEQPDKSFLCDNCKSSVTYIMRYTGKRVNHASAYRMGAERLAQVFNKESDKPPYITVSLQQAKEWHSKWHNYYNLTPWWTEIESRLNKDRTLVTTYGFKRIFFGTWGPELFKEATAFEPQSTVADHFNGKLHPKLQIPGGLLGIYELNKRVKFGKIINQSHDSCLLEIKNEAKDILPEIKKQLLRPMVINNEEFTIPVDCEIGESWGELQKLKLEI